MVWIPMNMTHRAQINKAHVEKENFHSIWISKWKMSKRKKIEEKLNVFGV